MAMLPSLFGPGSLDRMIEDLRRMQERFEQGFGALAPMPVLRTEWRPAIDVKETETGLTVTAELPGLSEQDVELTVDDDVLTIKGEKKSETTKDEKGWHVQERSYGAFVRTLQLPFAPKPDEVSASFAKGVLTVTLPKPPDAAKTSSRIQIKTD
ncbi:MAG: Hsp20/alpha crystallin family protein [Acetobacteraceae bacterium]